MNRLEFSKRFLFALASTVFIFLAGMAVPIFGAMLIPLAPQPVLGLGLKHGRRLAMWVLLAALALLALVGAEAAVVYSILAVMVLFLFIGFGRGWAVESVVVGSAAAMFSAAACLLVFSFGSVGRLGEFLRALLSENLEISLRFYERVGFSPESVAALRERAPQMIDVTLQILPALAFAGLATVALVNLFILYRRFPERRPLLISTGDLREWRSPEPLVWFFIISGFSLFLPGWETARSLALNLFLVIAVFYFFQGLAIVAYYFHHKNIPFFVRSLAYALILLEQIFTLLVVGLGLFDLWGDFRRLKKKDLHPSQAL